VLDYYFTIRNCTGSHWLFCNYFTPNS